MLRMILNVNWKERKTNKGLHDLYDSIPKLLEKVKKRRMLINCFLIFRESLMRKQLIFDVWQLVAAAFCNKKTIMKVKKGG